MKLLIAGGGTGGHLFPALALAAAVRAKDPSAKVLFVGTTHGIEAKLIPQTEFDIRYITARGLIKTGALNKILGLLELPRALFQSIRIIRDFKPDFVLGVGGYASGPTLIAAVLMRIPNAIQEQNSVMGTTNRILAKLVDRIFVSWPETEPKTPERKTICTGNPVREDVFKETRGLQREADKINLLVFGGSRGAKSINDALVGNINKLKEFSGRISIVHQTGVGNSAEIDEIYKSAGMDAQVSEFITDMGAAYQWADLVICRSGASSLAELTAIGKPAIVIPYPYATGDHQMKNAKVLEAQGAVRIVKDSALKNGALIKEIKHILTEPDVMAEMAANSGKAGRPDAANRIASEILSGSAN
jgi:UDP-N-acetylglucosamine--N-acetylmuramyl-(pentapeptide) pyrophosphoryl-undecaprenol N-acetylglucosamine transferase